MVSTCVISPTTSKYIRCQSHVRAYAIEDGQGFVGIASGLGARHEEGPTSPSRAQQHHDRDDGRRDHQQRTFWTEHPAGQPVGPTKATFEGRQAAPVLNSRKPHATS